MVREDVSEDLGGCFVSTMAPWGSIVLTRRLCD